MKQIVAWGLLGSIALTPLAVAQMVSSSSSYSISGHAGADVVVNGCRVHVQEWGSQKVSVWSENGCDIVVAKGGLQ